MAFDSLLFSKQLIAAGMQSKQAELLASSYVDMLNKDGISRADFQILQDQLALLREQVAFLQEHTRHTAIPPQPAASPEQAQAKIGVLPAFAVLIGALAAHTTVFAWLLDLF